MSSPLQPPLMIDFLPWTTPLGSVQWFREVMVDRGVDVQLFADPETGLEMGVFLPTTPTKRRILEALGAGQRLPIHPRYRKRRASRLSPSPLPQSLPP